MLKHLILQMHISGAKEYLLQFFSIPALAILILLEVVISNFHDLNYYSVKETFSNVFLASCNFIVDLSIRVFCFFVLGFFYQYHFMVISQPLIYWTILFLGLDLAFYWQHRIDHFSRFFWAVHVTHHSSTEFNLSTGFRSSVLQPLYRYFYFIPLALIGFNAIDIMFVYACCQIYGTIIHTRYIKKVGFLEYFLTTPSHHRVHHASNVQYLDKNMGMVLIIWDRIFGTFEAEMDNETTIYGLTKNPEPRYHPGVMIFHEWKSILKDFRRPLPLKTRLDYVFKPPGWSHDGSSQTSRQLQAALKLEAEATMFTLPISEVQLPVNEVQPPFNEEQLSYNEIQLSCNEIQLPCNEVQLKVNDAQLPSNEIQLPIPDKGISIIHSAVKSANH